MQFVSNVISKLCSPEAREMSFADSEKLVSDGIRTSDWRELSLPDIPDQARKAMDAAMDSVFGEDHNLKWSQFVPRYKFSEYFKWS